MRQILFIPFITIITYLMACSPNKHAVNSTDLKDIDTNIVLYKDGVKLRYHQYADILWSGEYTIMITGAKRNLVKFNERHPRPLDSATHNSIIRSNVINLEKKSADIPILNRDLLKILPSAIDTNLIINDQDNQPLHFYQYFGILYSGKGYIVLDDGKRYVWRLTDRFINNYRPMFSQQINMFGSACLQLLRADKVLVLKSKRKLYLQRQSQTFLSFSCNLGRNPVGDKQQEGDIRTPEGFYTLTGRTTQSKYGKGFYISYPDAMHIAAAKKLGVSPGGDVMIHGTSEARSNLKDWTNGCIALSNAGLDSLFKYVMPNTPIEIRK